jgi:hypothetical protein
MWKEDSSTKWGKFEADIERLTQYGPLNGLRWSKELALSAGWYTKDLSCGNIYQPRIATDTEPDLYLRKIAEWKQHKRVVIYPERFQWKDTNEMIWDLFMDDDFHSFVNLKSYLSPEMDSIGIACNCHPTFEQFCVIELGQSVRPLKDTSHLHTEAISSDGNGIIPFYHEHTNQVPQFMLPGDPRCQTTAGDEGFCDNTSDSESDDEMVDNDDSVNNHADDLVDFINDIRDAPEYEKHDDIRNIFSNHELKRWITSEDEEEFEDYNYNEFLSMAARHVLNDEGACETYGDVYGNFVPEVLSKYYVFSYKNLQILRVTSRFLWSEEGAERAFEYILSQQCIDKSIFKQRGEDI